VIQDAALPVTKAIVGDLDVAAGDQTVIDLRP
jgi:hypothetical protein